jgi:hypothetical protein
MEEAETLLGHLKDLVRVEVLGKRPATVHAEWDPVERIPHLVIGAGADRGDVGGKHRRRREVPAGGGLAGRLGRHVRRVVAHHQPARGRSDGEFETRLQVGLIEAREHAVRVARLEVRVEI